MKRAASFGNTETGGKAPRQDGGGGDDGSTESTELDVKFLKECVSIYCFCFDESSLTINYLLKYAPRRCFPPSLPPPHSHPPFLREERA